jgi:hypothetical protein
VDAADALLRSAATEITHMDQQPYSSRSNAKRAAEKLIRGGTAPSVEYDFRTLGDGRVEIVWRTGATDAEVETQREDAIDAEIAADGIAEMAEHSERLVQGAALEERLSEIDVGRETGDHDRVIAAAAEPPAARATDEDSFPVGAPVIVRQRAKVRPGHIFARIDARYWRVALEGDAPGVTVLVDGTIMHRRDGEYKLPSSTGAPTPRRARSAKSKPAPKRSTCAAPVARPRSKASELDAAAEAGQMPEKPIVTSHANLRYQKRFDLLAGLAAAGDWGAIAAYEVKGKNTYARQVAAYRDRLLAAHRATSRNPA